MRRSEPQPAAGNAEKERRFRVPIENPAAITSRPDAEVDGLGATANAPLPKGVYALFLLVDIASPAREARGVPRPLLITNRRTLIGRHAKAHLHVDDERTVRPKHAKLLYSEHDGTADFTIFPVDDSPVFVDGQPVLEIGWMLKNNNRVSLGSAELLFFWHLDARPNE